MDSLNKNKRIYAHKANEINRILYPFEINNYVNFSF